MLFTIELSFQLHLKTMGCVTWLGIANAMQIFCHESKDNLRHHHANQSTKFLFDFANIRKECIVKNLYGPKFAHQAKLIHI